MKEYLFIKYCSECFDSQECSNVCIALHAKQPPSGKSGCHEVCFTYQACWEDCIHTAVPIMRPDDSLFHFPRIVN